MVKTFRLQAAMAAVASASEDTSIHSDFNGKQKHDMGMINEPANKWDGKVSVRQYFFDSQVMAEKHASYYRLIFGHFAGRFVRRTLSFSMFRTVFYVAQGSYRFANACWKAAAAAPSAPLSARRRRWNWVDWFSRCCCPMAS